MNALIQPNITAWGQELAKILHRTGTSRHVHASVPTFSPHSAHMASNHVLFNDSVSVRFGRRACPSCIAPVGNSTEGVSTEQSASFNIAIHRQEGGAGFVGVPCRNQSGGCGKSLESDARPLTCTFDAPCPAVLINTAGARGIRRLIAITSGPTLIP